VPPTTFGLQENCCFDKESVAGFWSQVSWLCTLKSSKLRDGLYIRWKMKAYGWRPKYGSLCNQLLINVGMLIGESSKCAIVFCYIREHSIRIQERICFNYSAASYKQLFVSYLLMCPLSAEKSTMTVTLTSRRKRMIFKKKKITHLFQ
jgi:hypothetical protein